MALADRIGHLFEVIHPAQRGPFSYKEVSDAIEAAGGPTISATYLWQLRKGIRDNPTKSHLEALARFFGVPVVYFFDDEAAAGIEEQLNLLAALRDAGVQQVALRAVGLSDRSLAAIQTMIEQARQLEGLGDPANEAPTKSRKS
ncbi:hypothetical protein SAMN05444157_1216 [Frankineae bacterium MT45]|nr:hypothetical protein SAMN05444157_1216 [Frankineae bacterium MT45]